MSNLTAFQDQFPTLYAEKEKELGGTPTTDPNFHYVIRKAWILEWARDSYAKLIGWPDKPYDVIANGLENGEIYDITPTSLPGYFAKDTFLSANPVRKPTVVDSAYNYKGTAGYKENYWVDFANIRLGGGAFVNGLAQEETMVLESPELANAVASPNDYITRRPSDGDGVGVRQGCPRPLVVYGVNHVIHLTEPSPKPADRYWWTALDKDELRKYVVDLTKETCGRNFDVLAMAAPDLRRHVGGKSFTGKEIEVLQDLFNTFVAGFVKAAGHEPQVNVPADQKFMIHTGGIGTGIFGNDKVVVYVLQCLAAQHVGGVDLTFYMVDAATVASGRKAYEEILGLLKKDAKIDEMLETAREVLARY